MLAFGHFARVLRIWLACAALALLAAPAAQSRASSPIEIAAAYVEAAAPEERAAARQAASLQAESAPAIGRRPPPCISRRPRLDADHLVLIPDLYQRHCALLR